MTRKRQKLRSGLRLFSIFARSSPRCLDCSLLSDSWFSWAFIWCSFSYMHMHIDTSVAWRYHGNTDGTAAAPWYWGTAPQACVATFCKFTSNKNEFRSCHTVLKAETTQITHDRVNRPRQLSVKCVLSSGCVLNVLILFMPLWCISKSISYSYFY